MNNRREPCCKPSRDERHAEKIIVECQTTELYQKVIILVRVTGRHWKSKISVPSNWSKTGSNSPKSDPLSTGAVRFFLRFVRGRTHHRKGVTQTLQNCINRSSAKTFSGFSQEA